MRWIAILSMLAGVACGDDAANASGTTDDGSDEPSSDAGDPTSSDDGDPTTSTTESDATTTTSSSGVVDSTDSSATFGVEYCGNGVIDPGEECDDDNLEDGDACSATCLDLFDIVWTVSSDGGRSGSDSWDAVVTAADGDVYVAGSTAPPDSSADVWVRSFSSTGDPGWSLTWDGVDGGHDAGLAMAWLGSDLAIAGVSTTDASGNDILVMRVDVATQEVVWAQTFDGPGSGPEADDERDVATAIAIDPDGNLIVVGSVTADDEQRNAWIAEITPDGALSWERSWDDGASGDDAALSVDVDADGNVYALALRIDELAAARLLQYDDAGTPSDVEIVLPDDVSYFDFALLPGGGALATGVDFTGSALTRLDEDWIEEWTEHGTDAIPQHLAVDDDERAYAVGQFYTPGAPDGWVGAFTAAGPRWWSDTYDNPDANDQDGWRDVTVDEAGDVVVVGYETTLDAERNAIIRKYRPS